MSVNDSTSSSVAANIVQELEDKERRKNNVLFFNIPEPNTSNFEADRNYASKLCKDTFDLDVEDFEGIPSWYESTEQMQTIVSAV